ncbi:MAG: hypothetical protein NVSMB60_27800 [Mycobacterium sp.]
MLPGSAAATGRHAVARSGAAVNRTDGKAIEDSDAATPAATIRDEHIERVAQVEQTSVGGVDGQFVAVTAIDWSAPDLPMLPGVERSTESGSPLSGAPLVDPLAAILALLGGLVFIVPGAKLHGRALLRLTLALLRVG